MSEELRAGALVATLDGADLVDVRWGSLDVAGRMQVTVRDRAWGTVAPVLRSKTIERSTVGFRVVLEADHVDDDAAIAFAWRGTIEGRQDGTLSFAIDGSAERDSVHRRIGICVLHPWRAYVGATYRASNGSTGVFPTEIAPQPLRDGRYHAMVEAFDRLDVAFPGGVRARFAFEGESFELEDQRNWTDASFKTYPRPLARSEPRTLRAGERVMQRVAMRLEGAATGTIRVGDEATVVRVGGRTGRSMPPIGSSAPAHPSLRPAHLRVEVDVAGGDLGRLGDAAASAVPLEVALSIDPDMRAVEQVARALAGARLARVLVHLASGQTIPGSLVREIRDRLGGAVDRVPVVGGTSSFFSELNRLHPDGIGVDAIGFGVSPSVHATDERSMMETLEIQGQVVRRARELANGLPVVVSPVSLQVHLGSPFADAWTIGSVAALVAAGAASLTYAAGVPALAEVLSLEGAALLEVSVSQPSRVAALAVGGRLILANLTPVTRPLRIDQGEGTSLAPYEVRVESTG